MCSVVGCAIFGITYINTCNTSLNSHIFIIYIFAPISAAGLLYLHSLFLLIACTLQV